MGRCITAKLEKWPLRAPFAISRITFFESLVATVKIADDGGAIGQGECEPHDSDEAVAGRMLGAAEVPPGVRGTPDWLDGLTRANICERLPRGPVRNGVDCALWDLDAKINGVRAHELAELGSAPVPVMPTIGIDSPGAMERLASGHRAARWIKVKLGASDGLDEQRLEAVAGAAPDVALLVDANGGWTPREMSRILPLAGKLGVRIIEQPVRPALDDCIPKPVGDLLFCADESCLDRLSLPAVRQRYQYINIKLDKAGGLTEALALRREAELFGMGVMVGMMSGTSLAVAPAFVLAQGLDLIDLEVGFMTRDRETPMVIERFLLYPPDPGLWG